MKIIILVCVSVYVCVCVCVCVCMCVCVRGRVFSTVQNFWNSFGWVHLSCLLSIFYSLFIHSLSSYCNIFGILIW